MPPTTTREDPQPQVESPVQPATSLEPPATTRKPGHFNKIFRVPQLRPDTAKTKIIFFLNSIPHLHSTHDPSDSGLFLWPSPGLFSSEHLSVDIRVIDLFIYYLTLEEL